MLTDQYNAIDSTVVRAHPHGAGAKGATAQAIGSSRGGLSTKIDATDDELDDPTGLHLTLG